MTMLPVCSATTGCSSRSQISSLGGLQQLSLYRKTFEVRCVAEERVVFSLSSGNHLHGISFKTEVGTSFYSDFIVGREQSGSMGFMKLHPYQNELCDNKWECLDNWSHPTGGINVPQYEGMGDLKFVASSSVSSGEQELMDLTDRVVERTNIMPESVDTQNITTDVIPDDPASVSDTLNIDSDSLSSVKTNIGNIFAGFSESINASVNKGETALKNSIDRITSSVTSALKGVNGAVDNTFSKVTSSVDKMGESADNKFTGFSNELKEASNKVGAITVDVLRHAIVQIEDSLNQGATFVVYAYGSTKNLLPPEVQNVLSSSEERVVTISRPVGTAFQQIYTALEGLEKSLGLDPNDPIIPFVLFIGASAALWGSYWLFTYGGYEGDLTPKSTLELLRGKDDVVLIDVRPEDLRERYGIPDLRRAARFRYGNVTLPEVDGSVRKLLKSGKDLDDTLIAAVIRNLKIIQDRSKVVVMDADGTRSKSIARALKKLGIKRPYLVRGGFQSWVKEGLRVKELKPETTLTILNEEAEAILEDINPTPVKVVGYGVGFIAALYALLEWEKTLQFIGVIGIGQTIYRRIASYEDAEDFKQDVRQLLAPVRLGGQAISWAAGKLETNGIGLPTSPSSSDVQNRVLQAAAKHESQPSDGEETQDSSPNLTENVDLSEA
ncbi:uncharacterized protein LOC130777012 [Actinidia eriantha]|uniref:uncharacterized protein LOC130777012 n=1 Tax=Actinidia eriantha TaxID=165200 RepID=UPI002588C80D|nr:uncharacterized protein LOC130777012 [Actinidia eriantha]